MNRIIIHFFPRLWWQHQTFLTMALKKWSLICKNKFKKKFNFSFKKLARVLNIKEKNVGSKYISILFYYPYLKNSFSMKKITDFKGWVIIEPTSPPPPQKKVNGILPFAHSHIWPHLPFNTFFYTFFSNTYPCGNLTLRATSSNLY